MLANLLVALVALLHLGFLVLEMFLWTTPFGLKTFNLTREFAEQSRALAANQGLYNGFLAAGLVWGLLSIGMVFLLRRTVFGRYIYAIGNREAAAYLSGVPTRGVLVAAGTEPVTVLIACLRSAVLVRVVASPW